MKLLVIESWIGVIYPKEANKIREEAFLASSLVYFFKQITVKMINY